MYRHILPINRYLLPVSAVNLSAQLHNRRFRKTADCIPGQPDQKKEGFIWQIKIMVLLSPLPREIAESQSRSGSTRTRRQKPSAQRRRP